MKELLRKVFHAIGYDVHRLQPPRPWTGFTAERLARLGAPRTIIDVGVAFGTPSYYEAFPQADLVLVEPIRDVFQQALDGIRVARPGTHLVECAAGEAPGRLQIRLETEFPEKTSLLERTELTREATGSQLTNVRVERLDTIIEELGLSGPFGLKIDTEGYELRVLKGASRLFGQLEFVITEVSILKRFEGSYSFAEMIRFMDESGFQVTDLLDYHRIDAVGTRYLDLVFQPQG